MLLGRTPKAEVVKKYLEEHPAVELTSSNRSMITFQHGEETSSVEELVAMQLVDMKSQAEAMANEKIKDLILTVPGFWTEQERNAIINAADIAGMKVLTLINDGLAGTRNV
jgi:hypoxia up-regulated 1